ncbi:MAG: hypothetical protein B7X00_01345, partial [Legionella sp. 21-45-4]
YPLINRFLTDLSCDLHELLGHPERITQIIPAHYVDDHHRLIFINNTLEAIAANGRDPRPRFKIPRGTTTVQRLDALKVGTILTGIVGNVTHFGAFVDIGVNQDGLVHISDIQANTPNTGSIAIKTGDIVPVRIIEVDCTRRRIGLSLGLHPRITTSKSKTIPPKHAPLKRTKPEKPAKKEPTRVTTPFNTTMADAFAKLKQGIA